MIQEHLKKDPMFGHLFLFRGKKGLAFENPALVSLWWSCTAEPGGTVTLTPAQLAMLIEGIFWRPLLAG